MPRVDFIVPKTSEFAYNRASKFLPRACPLDSDLKDISIEEYKALRKEVEFYLEESRSQERYTVIAVGAIWSWLLSHRLTHWALWSIPIIITFGSAVRMIAINIHFGYLGKQLKQIECMFSYPKGWQHMKKSWTVGAAFTFLSLVLLAIAIYGFRQRCDLVKQPTTNTAVIKKSCDD